MERFCFTRDCFLALPCALLLAADFFAAIFLGAAFFEAVFFAAVFFAGDFFAAVFFAADFVAETFLLADFFWVAMPKLEASAHKQVHVGHDFISLAETEFSAVANGSRLLQWRHPPPARLA